MSSDKNIHNIYIYKIYIVDTYITDFLNNYLGKVKWETLKFDQNIAKKRPFEILVYIYVFFFNFIVMKL